ncbi:ribosome silencing factor [Agrococcus sp. ARC_14]|uniref:ribosome silencing factor n=1 Tax=Agrococcus sp. ARC_14 TaxID=2919927 RepID=UPI001F0692C9|nr:ribosome silencing factor [Agrococcus sp. ARC_14]MCH1883388.1 ribosome silencing factor [Agrococcus sp. ARC_14]
MSADDKAIALARAAARAADKALAVDLVGLDVSGQLPLTDVFLIATGRNERQVSAIAREVEDALLPAGAKPVRREGRADGRWVLLDFSDIVVHVFHEEERTYYQLERLWRDAPVIDLQVPEAPAADAE